MKFPNGDNDAHGCSDDSQSIKNQAKPDTPIPPINRLLKKDGNILQVVVERQIELLPIVMRLNFSTAC
jgi:hypothetical protein